MNLLARSIMLGDDTCGILWRYVLTLLILGAVWIGTI